MPRLLPLALSRLNSTLLERQLQLHAQHLSAFFVPAEQGSNLHTAANAAASAASEPDWADDANFQPHLAAPGLAEGVSTRDLDQLEPGTRARLIGQDRDIVVYQRLATDAASARRTYLVRDIYEEMQLNGIAPDRRFFEYAIRCSLQSTRVGDCFYYFEEMKKRGMQPSQRLKGSLVSVLARHGDMEAALKAFREVEPAETEKGFELSLAIINAFGERGNVAAVRRHLNEYLERYSEIPCAISYGYTALIKAYRKQPYTDKEQLEREVLGALDEAQSALAASTVDQKGWPLPVGALFALQKYGCHEAAVRLFESIPPQERKNPASWAYTHIIMSYIKDATGIFRWPKSEAQLRDAIKHQWAMFLKDKHDRLAEQRAAEEGSLQPEQGSDEASSEQADTQPHPSWDTAGSLDDSDDSSSEDDDISRHVDTSSDDDSDDDSDDLSSRQRSALQPPPRPPVQLSILQQLSGPAEEALKLSKMKTLRWVPREQYSKLRYEYLRGLANPDSWQRAIELHREMVQEGLELPAKEILEFIEASVQMEAMGCKGALQVGIDLLDCFGQGARGLRQRFINSLVGSHLLRFAVQRHVGDLSLAHKLWDLLIAQGDIPERASCRTYLVAMEQREPGSAQLAKVTEVVTKEYGVVNRPKGRAKLRAERRAAATAGAGGEDVQEPHAAAAAAADEEK